MYTIIIMNLIIIKKHGLALRFDVIGRFNIFIPLKTFPVETMLHVTKGRINENPYTLISILIKC